MAPKLDLQVIKVDDLLPLIPSKPLSAGDLALELAQVQVDQAPSLGIDGVSFVIGAQALLRIDAYNSPTDHDEDGVFGASAASADPLHPGPQLVADGQHAWLKYRVEAGVKASAGADVSFLAANASAGYTVVFADYHAHPLTQSTLDAVADDLRQLRFAVRATDFDRLGIGDALAYQVRGNLKASLTMKWSDVFAGNLGGLLGWLGGGALLGIETSLKATFAASVSVEDDFVLVFSRPVAGRIRVALRKAVSRDRSVNAALDVGVQFQNQAAVKSALQAAVEAVAGQPLGVVDDLLAKTDLAQLDEGQQARLRALLQRLGLGALDEGLATIRKRWQALKDKLEASVEALAKAKVGAGFRYEYLRTTSDATLLQALLADDDARRFHAALVKADLAAVVPSLPPRALENYLRETSDVRTQALGFTLGIGKWSFTGKDKKRLEAVVQERRPSDAPGTKSFRVAYAGLRDYTGTDPFGNVRRWSVDFKADTARFVEAPKAADLDYGLHLLLAREERQLSRDDLRDVIDEALVWQVVEEADEDDLLRALNDAVVAKARAEVQLELRLDAKAFRALLPLLAQGGDTAMAAACGCAMPFVSNFKALQQPRERQRLYAALWLRYLGDEGLDNPTLAGATARAFLAKDALGKQLAPFEGGLGAASWTFRRHVELYDRTRAAWRSHTRGLAELQDAITHGRGHDVFPSVFEQAEDLWQQSFHVRALGAYVAGLARAVGVFDQLERSLTLTLPERDQVFTFATARPNA